MVTAAIANKPQSAKRIIVLIRLGVEKASLMIVSLFCNIGKCGEGHRNYTLHYQGESREDMPCCLISKRQPERQQNYHD
jgi:hypothetical protein